MSAQVWIVGHYLNSGGCDGPVWAFQGVFDTEAKEEAACRNSWYFIAPAEMNESLPETTEIWPSARYPLEGDE